MKDQEFLGKGWKYPLHLKDNVIPFAGGEDSIRESIFIILGTAKGERVMRPDFGCDLDRMVFAPNNTSTAALAIHYVEEALKKYESRIELIKVDAGPDTEVHSRLNIYIEYKVITTNTKYNLVYPFYLEAGR